MTSSKEIVAAFEKIWSTVDVRVVSLKGLMHLIEKDFGRQKGSLKPYKSLVKEMVLKRIDASEKSKKIMSEKSSEKTKKRKIMTKKKTHFSSESSEEEVLKRKKKTHFSSESSEEEVLKRKKKRDFSSERSEEEVLKKRDFSSKKNESNGLKKLKEMARAAGLCNPRFHSILNQLNSNSEKEKRVRGKLQTAGYVLQGKYPTKGEIAQAKAKKNREKELEGIDTSAILPSSRRRQHAAARPSMKLPFSEESESEEYSEFEESD